MNHLTILLIILDHYEIIHGSKPLTIPLLKQIIQAFHNQVEEKEADEGDNEEDMMIEGYFNAYGDRDWS
jgi:hypothetical protein